MKKFAALMLVPVAILSIAAAASAKDYGFSTNFPGAIASKDNPADLGAMSPAAGGNDLRDVNTREKGGYARIHNEKNHTSSKAHDTGVK